MGRNPVIVVAGWPVELKMVARLVRRQLHQRDRYAAELRRIPKKDRPRCGARTRSGEPCQARAVQDGERCRLHGGANVFPSRRKVLEALRDGRPEAQEAVALADRLVSDRQIPKAQAREIVARVLGSSGASPTLKKAARAYAKAHGVTLPGG